MWEGDLTEALRVIELGQVRHEVLLGLAHRLEKDRTMDVIPIYRRILDESLHEGGDWGYLDIARLLQKYADLMIAAGDSSAFSNYLNAVRERFIADSQLQKILSEIHT
jgi:hypothetical protein